MKWFGRARICCGKGLFPFEWNNMTVMYILAVPHHQAVVHNV